MAATLTLERLRQLACERLASVGDGDPLDPLEQSLIALGIASSVTSLDPASIDRTMTAAFSAGATIEQVQEIVTLVSGLGVHSLMATAASLERIGASFANVLPKELDDRQSQLWHELVGDDPYWARFRAAMPNFLEALIRLSADQFKAFFTYCQLPWKTRAVSARTKELVALACDATPAHRFAPGFLLHLDNAIAIGVGRRAIMQALDMASDAPPHRGFG